MYPFPSREVEVKQEKNVSFKKQLQAENLEIFQWS